MPGQSPFYSLIQCYFPPEQVENANCISLMEADPADPRYPAVIKAQGSIVCGGDAVEAKSYGLFGILDACWNPDMRVDSPFTAEQWAKVLDPNMNTWMASVIFAANGWRAWTTCGDCQLCNVVGVPVLNPRGPVDCSQPGSILPLAVAIVAHAGILAIGVREHKLKGR